MMRLKVKYRWWIISIVLLVFLGVVVYRLWYYPYRLVQAVPGSTAVVFHLPVYKAKDSVRDSVETTALFRAFPELKQDYATFQGFFQRAGGSLPKDAEWMVQNLGGGQLALSLVADADSLSLEKALSAYQSEASVFRGQPIWRLSSPEGASLALGRCRNLLLLGRLPLQVEAGITQLKEGQSGWSVPGLPAAPRMYLRADNLSALGSGIWLPSVSEALRKLEPYYEGLSLSLEARADTLDIRGAIVGRALAAVPPPRAISDGALLNYLPDNLAWCYRKPLDSLPAGSLKPYFKEYMAPWLGEELAFASMALPGEEEDNQFLLLAIQPDADARERLRALEQELGALMAYPYQSFRIARLRADSLLHPLGYDMGTPFFTILGDYVAFSSSQVVLEQLASHLLAGKAMVQHEAFLQLWGSLQPGRRDLWAFSDLALLGLRLPAYLEQHRDAASRFLGPYEALMVVAHPDGAIAGRILPRGSTASRPASGMAWMANLDTVATSAPFYFPLPEGKQGFLIQDAAHALYLISGKGERLWKRPLDGPITGGVTCLPSPRQGRQRMAFATAEKIHLWDGRGIPVANFPLSLPAPASSPLLAADFEGQQRYHFFIACTNGKAYGYDYRGLPLEGWSPQEKLDSLVRQPMVHFQKDGKDYLLALSEGGSLHVFRRDGALRFEPVETGSHFQSPPFFQADADAERIALGDERGLGHIINFQGNYFRLKLMPQLEPGAGFLFMDLVGDHRKDYLAYRGRELVVRYYDGLKFVTHFSKLLDMPIDTAFSLSLSGTPGIGLLDRQGRKASLLDTAGAALPGFPLAGDVPFVLAPQAEGGEMAVIGYGASVYAYRLY